MELFEIYIKIRENKNELKKAENIVKFYARAKSLNIPTINDKIEKSRFNDKSLIQKAKDLRFAISELKRKRAEIVRAKGDLYDIESKRKASKILYRKND